MGHPLLMHIRTVALVKEKYIFGPLPPGLDFLGWTLGLKPLGFARHVFLVLILPGSHVLRPEFWSFSPLGAFSLSILRPWTPGIGPSVHPWNQTTCCCNSFCQQTGLGMSGVSDNLKRTTDIFHRNLLLSIGYCIPGNISKARMETRGNRQAVHDFDKPVHQSQLPYRPWQAGARELLPAPFVFFFPFCSPEYDAHPSCPSLRWSQLVLNPVFGHEAVLVASCRTASLFSSQGHQPNGYLPSYFVPRMDSAQERLDIQLAFGRPRTSTPSRFTLFHCLAGGPPHLDRFSSWAQPTITNYDSSKENHHRKPPDLRFSIVVQLREAHPTGRTHRKHLPGLQRFVPDQLRTRRPRKRHSPFLVPVCMRHILQQEVHLGKAYQFQHGVLLSLRAMRG